MYMNMTPKMPTRYYVPIMIFLTCAVNYMMRTNLSVNIVAMVPVGNVSLYDSPNSNYVYWTAYQKAIVLGGFYWGYLVACFMTGALADKWSPRLIVFYSALLCGLLTLLSPVSAKQGYELFLVVRILLGFFSGACYPSFHLLISKWAIPSEKGLFVGTLIGSNIGTFFSWVLGGYIVDTFGWEWGFYAFGLFSPVVATLWWLLIYDSPETHPRITPEEQKYIVNGMKGKNCEKFTPPLMKILTSLPVWSLMIANFGVGWGLHFVSTTAPTYIANTLAYNIKSTGVLSALVSLSRSVIAIIAGFLGDICLRKKLFSLRMIRRGGTVVSHVIPGLTLLAMTYTGFPAIVYVTIFAISMSSNGLVSLTTAANAHDLTTNFAGTLTGLTSSAVTFGGIITPLVVAYYTKQDETDPELWHSVFYIGSAVYIATGLQFLLFISTKKQPWDSGDAKMLM